MSSLNLYDTKSRKVSSFKPIKKGEVGIYLCGATVQAPPHIGHIRSGVNFDILRRWLITSGYKVTFIRNVTDIDDKIIHKATHEEIPWWQVAAKYERSFTDAYNKLNVLPPTYEPLATGHITQMIELIKKLIDNGSAYAPGNGDVYLEVTKVKDYLSLSNQKLDDLLVADDADLKFKKDPKDFALWKAAKKDEPSWPTPWGDGRPGWHIECSAMAQKYLGKEFDLHCGGLDLIFPHHENEIAQSICANDSNILAKYWMHNGYLTVNGKKMSKSEGNFVTINNLKNNFNGQIVRLSVLGTHYRQPLDWNLKILETNKKILENWYTFYSAENDEINDELLNILLDDLNTPKFITNIHSLYNKAKTGDTTAKKDLNSALKFIGLFNQSDEQFNSLRKKSNLDVGQIENLIDLRNLARKNKDFKKADKIRLDLENNGILIEDLNDKTHWKYK